MKDDLIYLLGFKDAKYIAEKELEKNPCAANAQKVFEYSKRIDEVLANIEKDYNELKKYKDLEKEVGCPLEVYLGINQCDITTVYDKNGIEYTIKPDTIIKNSFMAVDGFTLIECMWNMYCKTWWLKKDRSE